MQCALGASLLILFDVAMFFVCLASAALTAAPLLPALFSVVLPSCWLPPLFLLL